MTRIARKLGYSESNSFVTNTVIQFTLHNESYQRLYRIKSRDTNLIKFLKLMKSQDKLLMAQLT